jgi:hypothetical protein
MLGRLPALLTKGVFSIRSIERFQDVVPTPRVPRIASRSGNGFAASIAEALSALIAVIDTE